MKFLFETYQPGEYIETNRIINTPSDFARKSLFYVQEIGYLKCIKSHINKRYNLSSYLFCILLSGKGEFLCEGRRYPLKQNDCILLDCRRPYMHQSDPEHPWELLWVHFNGYAAGDYYEYYLQGSDRSFHPREPEAYIHLLEQLLILHQKKEAAWELIASKRITELLTLCVLEKCRCVASGAAILDKLQAVRTYLNQNFRKKISLDQLAEEFYISKYHLSREFKRIYGVTILNYITAKRITYAKELLRFTNQSIEEIAAACGYPDASYFNKVFLKAEAMTGTEFRRKWVY
jgi:AraC family transcriptional regulator of arabinose operon